MLFKSVYRQIKNFTYSIVFIGILLSLSFASEFINIGNVYDFLFIFINSDNYQQISFFISAFVIEAVMLLSLGFVSFDRLNFLIVALIMLSIVSIVIFRNNNIFTFADQYYHIPVTTAILLCFIYKGISMNDLKKVEKVI